MYFVKLILKSYDESKTMNFSIKFNRRIYKAIIKRSFITSNPFEFKTTPSSAAVVGRLTLTSEVEAGIVDVEVVSVVVVVVSGSQWYR